MIVCVRHGLDFWLDWSIYENLVFICKLVDKQFQKMWREIKYFPVKLLYTCLDYNIQSYRKKTISKEILIYMKIVKKKIRF